MAIISTNNFTVQTPVRTQRQNYLPALITLGVVYFIMGLVTCLNDTLVPYFKKGFSLSYTQSSFVQLYFFLTYGIASIPAGKLVERIGYKKGMVAGFSTAALGALCFLPAASFHQYSLFLLALFVIAIGVVILQVAANPYITALGSPETASSRFNMIQAMGSVGTTIAPLIGTYFILSKISASENSSDAVKYPYAGIAILLIVIALIVSRLPLPTIGGGQGVNDNSLNERKGNIFRFKNLSFGIPAIFMYVGAEVCIGTYLTNYAADSLGIPISQSNTFVAFYWGAMLVGRFLGSAILRFVKTSTALAVCAVMSITAIVFSLLSSGYIAVWSLVAVGLFNSIMFASIFSLSVNGLGKHATRASGLLSTAIVGGAVMSFGVAFLKDHYSWQIAFILPLICYAYILYYSLYGCKPTANLDKDSI